jgi:hypothetical protein
VPGNGSRVKTYWSSNRALKKYGTMTRRRSRSETSALKDLSMVALLIFL